MAARDMSAGGGCDGMTSAAAEEVRALEAAAQAAEQTCGVVERIGRGKGRSRLFASSPTGRELAEGACGLAAARDTCRRVQGKLRSYDLEARRSARDLLDCLLRIAVEAQGRRVVCVLAPMFDEANVTDGYVRRVRNVDGLIPDGVLRVYLFKDPAALQVSTRAADADHILVTYRDSADASELFDIIAEHASLVYCHSIYQFDGAFLGRCPDAPFVLDFHGVVPEEEEYAGRDARRVEQLGLDERAAVARAGTIVVVSRAMADHIRSKYPDQTADTRFVVMPIFDVGMARAACDGPSGSPGPAAPGASSRPVAVYAGGLQEWQRIGDMLNCIEGMGDSCAYRVFVPDPPAFAALAASRALPADLSVATRAPEEMAAEYALCQYGFVLREDCVVNRVACPTKLVEYLANGIVPVVETPDIGDFGRLGMRFVSKADFQAGALPGEEERLSMARDNRRVLEELVGWFERGREEVSALFAS